MFKNKNTNYEMQQKKNFYRAQRLAKDFEWLHTVCSERRLHESAKWAAEMDLGILKYLNENSYDPSDLAITTTNMQQHQLSTIKTPIVEIYKPENELKQSTADSENILPTTSTLTSPKIRLALSLFDLTEYTRAMHILRPLVEDTETPDDYITFMYFYAMYLSIQRKANIQRPIEMAISDRLENDNNTTTNRQRDLFGFMSPDIAELRRQLSVRHARKSMDAYTAYLYATILHETGVEKKLTEMICIDIVNELPAFYPAWQLLADIQSVDFLNSKEFDTSLLKTRNWACMLFALECQIKSQRANAAKCYLEELVSGVYKHCQYVTALLARACKECNDTDKCMCVYENMFDAEPHRLDDLDAYSCELFVHSSQNSAQSRQHRAQLIRLARQAHMVDPYSEKTCIVLGNYYAKSGLSQKAINCFDRAIRLSGGRKCDGIWTLIGHEYVEMKNTSAAFLAYQRALETNPYDHRALYGLGVLYDVMQMPSQAIFYFNQAHLCRPSDSRMLIALGDMYTKTKQIEHANKCFWRAHCVGDVENIALLKLARLFKNIDIGGTSKQAADCYLKYLQMEEDRDVAIDTEEETGECSEEKSECYKYVAEYLISIQRYADAAAYASACAMHPNTREASKELLKKIELTRSYMNKKTPQLNVSLKC